MAAEQRGTLAATFLPLEGEQLIAKFHSLLASVTERRSSETVNAECETQGNATSPTASSGKNGDSPANSEKNWSAPVDTSTVKYIDFVVEHFHRTADDNGSPTSDATNLVFGEADAAVRFGKEQVVWIIGSDDAGEMISVAPMAVKQFLRLQWHRCNLLMTAAVNICSRFTTFEVTIAAARLVDVRDDDSAEGTAAEDKPGVPKRMIAMHHACWAGLPAYPLSDPPADRGEKKQSAVYSFPFMVVDTHAITEREAQSSYLCGSGGTVCVGPGQGVAVCVRSSLSSEEVFRGVVPYRALVNKLKRDWNRSYTRPTRIHLKGEGGLSLFDVTPIKSGDGGRSAKGLWQRAVTRLKGTEEELKDAPLTCKLVEVDLHFSRLLSYLRKYGRATHVDPSTSEGSESRNEEQWIALPTSQVELQRLLDSKNVAASFASTMAFGSDGDNSSMFFSSPTLRPQGGTFALTSPSEPAGESDLPAVVRDYSAAARISDDSLFGVLKHHFIAREGIRDDLIWLVGKDQKAVSAVRANRCAHIIDATPEQYNPTLTVGLNICCHRVTYNLVAACGKSVIISGKRHLVAMHHTRWSTIYASPYKTVVSRNKEDRQHNELDFPRLHFNVEDFGSSDSAEPTVNSPPHSASEDVDGEQISFDRNSSMVHVASACFSESGVVILSPGELIYIALQANTDTCPTLLEGVLKYEQLLKCVKRNFVGDWKTKSLLGLKGPRVGRALVEVQMDGEEPEEHANPPTTGPDGKKLNMYDAYMRKKEWEKDVSRLDGGHSLRCCIAGLTLDYPFVVTQVTRFAANAASPAADAEGGVEDQPLPALGKVVFPKTRKELQRLLELDETPQSPSESPTNNPEEETVATESEPEATKEQGNNTKGASGAVVGEQSPTQPKAASEKKTTQSPAGSGVSLRERLSRVVSGTPKPAPHDAGNAPQERPGLSGEDL